MKTSDLWSKDVVNIVDGKVLGMVEDVELDLKAGRINAIVIPGKQGLFGIFGGTQDLVINWNQIQKIGQDVILVQVEKFMEPEQTVEEELEVLEEEDLGKSK